MRQFFFALAFCGAVLATPLATADDVLERDYRPLLQTCISVAMTDEEFAACREATSRPCIEDDGGTTQGVMSCYDQEAEVWTERMTRAVAQLSLLFPDSAQTIANAQEAWRAFREHECQYEIQMWGEGSGARVSYMQCIAEMTAERALTLMWRQRHPG